VIKSEVGTAAKMESCFPYFDTRAVICSIQESASATSEGRATVTKRNFPASGRVKASRSAIKVKKRRVSKTR